jgi:hypothetical protein
VITRKYDNNMGITTETQNTQDNKIRTIMRGIKKPENEVE